MVLSILTTGIVANIPHCDFYDTVDLGDIQPVDDSYTYKNVKIPRNKTGEYNQTAALFTGEKQAPMHRRGCLCHFAECVLFCCYPAEELPNAYMKITFENKSTMLVDALKNHVVQTKFNLSCDNFIADKENQNFAITKVRKFDMYIRAQAYLEGQKLFLKRFIYLI